MFKGISVAALTVCLGACASSAEVASPEAIAAPAAHKSALQTGGEMHELDAAEAPEIADASSEGGSEELICRREKEAGSNFSRKVCYSKAELETRAEEDQDAVRRMRRIGTHSDPDPGG